VRPRSTVLAVAAVALATVLAACSSTPGGSPTATLPGTSWSVKTIAGTPTLPDAPASMTFAADGTVSGATGCNQYSGQYTVDGDKLTVTQLASTMMACEAEKTAQEQAFTAALNGATSYSISESGELTIQGQAVIVAEAETQAPTPAGSAAGLAGTSWTLADAAALGPQLAADAIPTIAFGADGTVSGSAGCNTFSGTYTTDGASLTFGPLASTKMACAEPAMTVEGAYLTALAGVTGYTIGADGKLVLQGTLPLTFAPA
jgi:heat shock protein HslJ